MINSHKDIISHINERLHIYNNYVSQKYTAYIGELSEEDKINMDYPFVIEPTKDDMVLAISVNYGRNRENPEGILVEVKCLITKNTLKKGLEEIENKYVRGLMIELRRHLINHAGI